MKHPYKQYKQSWRWSYRITGILAVVFMLIAVLGFYLVQRILLRNAQEMGNELASRYAEMELWDVRAAEPLLTLGVRTLEEHTAQNDDPDAQIQWTLEFFDHLQEAAGGDLTPFAVIQGRTISPENAPVGDVTATSWYTQVLRSGGEMLITNAGIDLEDGYTTVIIAQRCRNSQNIMGFYVDLRDHAMMSDVALPEGTSYYLCDDEGQLLYAWTQLEVDPTELARHIRTMFQQIQAGQLENAQKYVYDMTGQKRAIYYHALENGGVSIITVPYASLLGGLRHAFNLVMTTCCIFLLFLAIISIREYRLQRKLSRVNETVAALGNLYYAIYRINWARGTYEIVKGAEDVLQRLPSKGLYSQLLTVFADLIDADTYAQFESSFSLRNMRQLVEQDATDFGGDFRRRFGDEYLWVNVRLLFDASLRQNEAILCFRQIHKEKTQQIQQAQVLDTTLKEAGETGAARLQFFSQMSHDMRTPLNVIAGNVELARRRSDDPAVTADCFKKIGVAAQQLLELINDVLEMSRMEQTDLHLHNVPCDLQDTVDQCLSAFQAQADLEHKTLGITFSLTHRQVYADALRLQQVLNNLVSNAMKFTNPGDIIQVEVTQPPRQDHDICRIVVRDTGIGMSQEFLPKLFTPYARESRFGIQTVLGTGLGMAIVKTIITRMGGQIQVESQLGQGTTFTLTIPMEPVTDTEAETAAADVPDPAAILGGKTVLVAEDFEMNLEIVTELLKLCGATVVQARNGQEAVDAFAASEPGGLDLILMDMNMPILDGCAAAAAIRAMDRPDAATIPILAVTANAFAEDISATAKAGMNAHIAKPIDLQQLAAVLRDMGMS